MTYRVRFTTEAEGDVLELTKAAGRALNALRKAVKLLEWAPFACRKAEGPASPFVRQLVISFGSRGYVALFEVEDEETVTILAVRHQRESDFR